MARAGAITTKVTKIHRGLNCRHLVVVVVSLPQRSGETLPPTLERLDLQVGRDVFVREHRQWLLEELRIEIGNFQHEALPGHIETQPFDCRQGGGMEQSPLGWPGLLDGPIPARRSRNSPSR